MALTDTFTKNAKHSGKPAGDKHRDGNGMYLLVTAGGKYWRMDYRFAEKRKTLALGVYPEVSLAKARQRREKARELLADGIDPGIAKREEKQAKAAAAGNTFEAVAEQWLKATAAKRAAITMPGARSAKGTRAISGKRPRSMPLGIATQRSAGKPRATSCSRTPSDTPTVAAVRSASHSACLRRQRV